MSDKLLVRSGYVYCVRRSGKTHYRLGNAPAGQLVDRLKKLAQTEENPTTLVLVGWIEVQDHVVAIRTLRETFHLYRLQDHWFDFRVTRSSELKSLLGAYADLMVKLPVAEPLIVHEAQPQYDRKFGFFEAIHAANGCAYFPPETSGTPVFPLPKKPRLGWRSISLGAIGLSAVAIGLSSMYRLQASQSSHASPHASPPISTNLSANPPPSSKPSTLSQLTPEKTPPPPKSTPSTPPKPVSSKASPQTIIWSESSEGARLRSNPDSSDNEIDFLPNGTPIVLGESSDAWQEIILPDGRRGWVFNDLIQN
jgi:Bacterial SH3 domain